MPRRNYAIGEPVERGIYYRGQAQYQAKVRVKGFPSQSKTCRTIEQARKWGVETMASMSKGTFRDPRPAKGMTVGDLIQRYIDEVVP